MRHRKKKNKLNRSTAHTKATLSSIAGAVIEHDKITTTLIKAKRTKPVVDKLITLGKRGDLHSIRQAAQIIQDKDLLKNLFDQVAPRFKKRKGGYTRIIRKGVRAGDNAPLVILELTEKQKIKKKEQAKPEKKVLPEKDKKDKPKEEKQDKKEDKKGLVDGLRGLFKKKNS